MVKFPLKVVSLPRQIKPKMSDNHSMAFKETLLKSKKRLLQMHFESGVGHIGGNLSCLDVLMVLHHQIMNKDDQFILSKGHSAGALYITLWSMNKLKDEDLKLFHKEPTKLSGHPAPKWREEIIFATGSLGHGFSLASGLALAKKLKNQPGRVFCLTSDGEWQEGSNWEALIFAHHQKLDSLTLIVDANGLQGFGSTKEVASMDSLTEKFKSFGVPVEEIDGHDLNALEKALSQNTKGLRAIIAHTTKGKGISFMENKMEWHYLPLKEPEYQMAIQELDKS
jgi:transketolase